MQIVRSRCITQLDETERLSTSEQDASKEATLAHRGHRVTVLRLPMGGSCAIPLAVTAPANVTLLSWAFAEFNMRPSTNPVCLMVLGGQAAEHLTPGGVIAVRTHIRDLRIALAETPVPLSESELAIIAKLLLAALAPANVDGFTALLPLLAPAIDAIAGETGGLEASTADAGGRLTAIGLDFVPQHLIVRTLTGYVNRPIDGVRVRTGSRMAVDLMLTRSSGNDRFDLAILIGTGRYVVCRITSEA